MVHELQGMQALTRAWYYKAMAWRWMDVKVIRSQRTGHGQADRQQDPEGLKLIHKGGAREDFC